MAILHTTLIGIPAYIKGKPNQKLFFNFKKSKEIPKIFRKSEKITYYSLTDLC